MKNIKLNNFIYKIDWFAFPLTQDVVPFEEERNLAIVIDEDSMSFYLKIKESINSIYKNSKVICIIMGKEFKQNINSVYTLNFGNEKYTELFIEKKITDVVFFYKKDNTLSIFDTDELINKIWEQTKSLVDLLNNFTNKFTPRVTIITENSSVINSNHSISSLIRNTLWSAARVIKLEFSEIDLKCIDLESTSQLDLHSIIKEIFFERNNDRVAIKNGYKYIPQLVKFDQIIDSNELLNRNKTFLIIGGTGGIGLIISEWLAASGANHILLVSRSEPDKNIQNKLNDIKKFGVNIRLYNFDISKKSDVNNLFNTIEAEGYIIDNIIHTAGIINDATYPNISKEILASVLLPKVSGIINIYNNLKKRKIKLDKLIIFSSSVSLIGNIGQISYAIANAFLDSFTYFLKYEGIEATTINWGMWDKIGMSKKSEVQSNLELSGFKGINKENGLKILSYLLKNKDILQLIVLPMDWKLFLTRYNIEKITFYNNVSCKNSIKNNFPSSTKQNKTIVKKIDEKKIELLIKDFVSDILGVDKKDITNESNLSEFGMDSLSALELKNNIQKQMRVNLSFNSLYKFKNLQEISDYIIKELQINS
ncbi:MAG: SDR family NAD(P)-dependent oxidoreductase [Arcobacter sp.]|nr:SDR family NAD(P)-dependent oxidoreductase [Arcobacter sp.]